MTRKEEIKEKAEEIAVKHAKTYTVSKNNSHKNNILFNESSIIECEVVANEIAIWADKTMIEKACEWLKDDMLNQNAFQGRLERLEIIDGIIERFKKAMEE